MIRRALAWLWRLIDPVGAYVARNRRRFVQPFVINTAVRGNRDARRSGKR